MNRSWNRRSKQNKRLAASSEIHPSLRKKYLTTIAILIVLSILNVSLESDEVTSNLWSLSIELSVTPLTLILVFLFWLPVLAPWLLTQFPQLQGSLNWLREHGIEEVETNLLRIKLRYGVQEASQNYEEKIWTPETTNVEPNSQETNQQIERRYQDAIGLIDATSNIDSVEALKRIDQLATFYDRVRAEMPSSSNRTRLMRDISSIMWTLVPKAVNFPVWERLNSRKAGERLSAYKYLEWKPSSEYIDLLLSRAVGILEVPFGQKNALLALKRVVTTNELPSAQLRETIVDILNWSANLEYIKGDRSRQRLMVEIASILKTDV